MVIRFTSTLTDEDETRIAAAVLKAVGNLLAIFPISYSIRIETTAGEIVEDGRAALNFRSSMTTRDEEGERPSGPSAAANRQRRAW